VFRKYAVFSGRARRSEYWYWVLFNAIVTVLLLCVDAAVGAAAFGSPLTFGLFSSLYGLAAIIPGTAVSIRRLHDGGHSGWALFWAFLPLLGAIVLLVLFCQDSQPGENRYGPNPKLPATASTPDAPWRQPV
jgi:uncharacterized membrane protein YhaH (DUF805 family)